MLKLIELWLENFTLSLQLMLLTLLIEEIPKAKLNQDKWIYSILKDKKSKLHSLMKSLKMKMDKELTLLQREPTTEAKSMKSHKSSWMAVVKLSLRMILLERRTMRSKKNLQRLWESFRLEEMVVWAYQMQPCQVSTTFSTVSICQAPKESTNHQPRGWSSIKIPLGATRPESRLELEKENTLKRIAFPQARVTLLRLKEESFHMIWLKNLHKSFIALSFTKISRNTESRWEENFHSN